MKIDELVHGAERALYEVMGRAPHLRDGPCRKILRLRHLTQPLRLG